MMAHETAFVLIGGAGFLGKSFSNLLTQINRGFFVVEKGDLDNDLLISKNYSRKLSELRERIFSQNSECVIIDFAYASVPKTSFDDPVNDFSENLSNVIKHLDFALALKASRYVYISSGGTIYGNQGRGLVGEDFPTLPISPYGISKLACERYVNMYYITHGLDTLIVRPSNIYGPGQKPFRGQGFISTALACAYQNKSIAVFGDGAQVRDYLYVSDFCGALVEVISNGIAGGVYNIGSELGYSINNVIDQMNNVTKREGKGLKVEYLENRPFDVTYNVLDCKKIKSSTEWRPTTDLAIGINQTWQWINQFMKSH
jgi:UDP-glucose 4-epimerase